MQFDYTVTSSKSIDQVVAALTATLRDEGFGVLGVLDFEAILKQKGVELGREYRLMEVCNPQAAKKALDKDVRIGLLLPCTIAVYRTENITRISLLRPSQLLSLAPESQLGDLGEEIEEKLKAAVDKARQ